MLSLENLLNPELVPAQTSTGKENVGPQLQLLSSLANSSTSLLNAPSSVRHALELAVHYFTNGVSPSVSDPSIINLSPLSSPHTLNLPPSPQRIQTRHHVAINRQTCLQTVCYYPQGTLVEYPETSATGIGHLFTVDPACWINPALNFAYSLGGSRGMSQKDKSVRVSLLVDDSGEPVPCREMHTTCRGCKICPFNGQASTVSHCKATREDLHHNLLRTRDDLQTSGNLQQQLRAKTLSLWSSLRKFGCGAPPFECTVFLGSEHVAQESWNLQKERARRGHDAKPTCQGRILFEHSYSGQPYIRCEHYIKGHSTDHLINFDVGRGLYDIDYLEALFLGDDNEVCRLEEEAFSADNTGRTLTTCDTISNASSIKVYCSHEHRDPSGQLVMAEMEHMNCQTTFRVFEPLEDYRAVCPRVLIVCRGSHSHPIPRPSKTPPLIRFKIFKLLESLGTDLADLTPRRFLRHTMTRSHLQNTFPHIPNPTLSDLHVSLSNREHLRVYIERAKSEAFPEGTGWEGLLHLKECQDQELPSSEHYIRYAAEVPSLANIIHTEDERDSEALTTDHIRVIVCMSKASSIRLLEAQFLQSDIGFKRIIGFQEFELGGRDHGSGTVITYCRVYLNRQTAAAHHFIFKKIEEIVQNDTGKSLQWRHLHSNHIRDFTGILHWAADQHGGQAKGLGLHLKELAQGLPHKFDLHEPHRLLASLSEYEHLHRLIRLCHAHVARNIKICKVPESVKTKMRSLVCVEHPDFEGTLEQIELEGGKEGADWVHDKRRSQFALQGICWQKSHIPKLIWQMGDSTSNIIESLHADVNTEGIGCSLVTGVRRGHHFDNLKLKTLSVYEMTGIRPTYAAGHVSESALRSLKRKSQMQTKILSNEDREIQAQNGRLQKAQDTRNNARERLGGLQEGGADYRKAKKALTRAESRYEAALEKSIERIGLGSGRVALLLSANTSGRRAAAVPEEPSIEPSNPVAPESEPSAEEEGPSGADIGDDEPEGQGRGKRRRFSNRQYTDYDMQHDSDSDLH